MPEGVARATWKEKKKKRKKMLNGTPFFVRGFKFPPRVPFFFYDSFAPLLTTFEEFNFSFPPPFFSFSFLAIFARISRAYPRAYFLSYFLEIREFFGVYGRGWEFRERGK